MKKTTEEWTIEITPERGIFSIPVREIFDYRDLLYLFVRRDFVATYKQTVLGPLWFLIQPILTTVMMVFVFGTIAGLSTDGLPKVLFYLSGVTLWFYFSSSLTKTSTTFTANARLFGKVYFPRLLVPISVVISNLVLLAIQVGLFLVFYVFYYLRGDVDPNPTIALFPILILILGMLGLASGLVISALTTKYRDLSNLVSFGIQLLMYATPIIYPVSTIPEKYRFIIEANPISAVIETFRHGFLGVGEFSWLALGYSFSFACVLLLTGTLIFNKIEATFMDTV
ncbi:MAG: ABC transporter permease [Verrucomicrobiota bacterium]